MFSHKFSEAEKRVLRKPKTISVSFFDHLNLDQRQRRYIFHSNILSYSIISKPTGIAWSAARDLVRKYDEDGIKMSADLGQMLLCKGTKEH